MIGEILCTGIDQEIVDALLDLHTDETKRGMHSPVGHNDGSGYCIVKGLSVYFSIGFWCRAPQKRHDMVSKKGSHDIQGLLTERDRIGIGIGIGTGMMTSTSIEEDEKHLHTQ